MGRWDGGTRHRRGGAAWAFEMAKGGRGDARCAVLFAGIALLATTAFAVNKLVYIYSQVC